MTKKTESIEIRLSPELKAQLAARCQAEGRSMSDTVRGLIESQVQGAGVPNPDTGDDKMIFPSRKGAVRAAFLALPVVALGAAYGLSADTSAPAPAEIRVQFTEIDRDMNGAIDAPEYARFLTAVDAFEPEPDCAAMGEPCTVEAWAEDKVGRVDSDGDGRVGFDEFEAAMLRDRAEVFIHHDMDANGFVTVDEMALVHAMHRVEDGATLDAACEALVETETPAGALDACGEDPHGLRVEFAALDSDRDGRVGLLEFLHH
ncbi:MAG: EF-hand domain-containing protein [Pseudomonadota bacterium]